LHQKRLKKFLSFYEEKANNSMQDDQRAMQTFKVFGEILEIMVRIEQDPEHPNDHVELAKKFYELAHSALNREGALPALQQAIQELERAMALFEQQNLLMEAVDPANFLVALANDLATKFDVVDYVEAAFAMGEKMLLANMPLTAQNAPFISSLAHNLANACSFFAQRTDDPQELQSYYEKGLVFATYAREGLDLNERLANDRVARESFLHQFIILHFRLAMARVVQFTQHIHQAYHYLEEYITLADTFADAAMQERAKKLARTIHLKLDALSLPSDHTDQTKLSFQIVEDRVNEAKNVAREILLLHDTISQRQLLAKTLDIWYAELASELTHILFVAGVNYHLCRMLLALGSVTSGRLWLAESHVSPSRWLFSVRDGKAKASLQEIPHLSRSELVIIGILVGIDSLLASFEQVLALREEVRRDLRRRNVSLLSTVLSRSLSPQQVSDIAQTEVEDLQLLLKRLPAGARQEVLDSYDEANSLI
jgi:hypothetical protein